MKTYINLLSVIASVIVVFLTANSVNAEVYKVSKIKHIEYFKSTDIDTEITELIYDDDGRLIRFIEYYEGRANDPQIDITLVWENDQVNFSGLIDWDYEHGVISLDENGLANSFVSYEGYSSRFKYEDNKLSQLYNIYGEDSDDYEIVDITYQNEELVGMTDQYNYTILLSYDASPRLCNIPSLFINHNYLFYYRFIAYAGLLGHPLKYCPSSFNRYNKGWMPLEYTFDENGNISKIYSPNGGFTHAMENETFIFEYTKTNSLETVHKDKIQMINDGKTITFIGKSSDDIIQVFDIFGRLVNVSEDNKIVIEASGMYVIRVGMQTFKTIIP